MFPSSRTIFLAAAFLLLPGRTLAADGIHWTFTSPTSVSIDWRGPESTVRYGLTTAYGLSAAAATPSPLPYSSAGPYWEARLGGLLPNTSYHYSIGGGPDHVFRTMPGVGDSFTVYVEGDVGDSATYSRVAAVQSLIAQGAPSFVLVVGDLTYGNDNGQAVVDRHFNDVQKWSRTSAYMPAWGNHEWSKSTDDLRNYKGRFDLPNPQASPGAPSAGCCGEDWYWFDCGGVRFIAYPEPYSGAWSDWNTRARTLMDQAQADPAIRFIVTFGHRPAYSSGYHSGNATLRSYMDALGASHSKYVLNLNGHSHNYERSLPQSGVTHVTVGIGGSTLESSSGTCAYAGGCPPPAWSAFRALHHGALRLRFTGGTIRGEAVCGPAGDSGSNRNDITCAFGDVFDSFTIGGDEPPLVTAPPLEPGAPGVMVSVPVTAADPDGDAITSLTADLGGLPAGNNATFSVGPMNSSGLLTWTPAAADTGTFLVSFRAGNALSASASTTIRVVRATTGLSSGPFVARLAIERVVPNPSAALPRVVFSAAGDDPVLLELVDAGGRTVMRRELASPGPGRQGIALGSGPSPPPGVYWLRLTQGANHTSAPFVIVR